MKNTNAMLDCKLQFKVYTIDLQIDLEPKYSGFILYEATLCTYLEKL